jgi:hypothetical protein
MKSGHSTSQNMQAQPADLRLALWRYGRNAAKSKDKYQGARLHARNAIRRQQIH